MSLRFVHVWRRNRLVWTKLAIPSMLGNLADPMLSPIYGDLHNFPPTILTTGTRDLLLSNTVRVNQKLRQSGVETTLQVFEGQSHAQFYRDDRIPEVQQAMTEIAGFFDKHLGQSGAK